MLLLICVNLRTHTRPAASGSGWAFPQLEIKPISLRGEGVHSEGNRTWGLGGRAELAGWLRARALPAFLGQVPSSSRAPLGGDHTWLGLQAGQRAMSSLCRGDTQPVPLGFGVDIPAQ